SEGRTSCISIPSLARRVKFDTNPTPQRGPNSRSHDMNWKGRKVLVTGGASFIGSHLVQALLRRGAQVRIIDNLSSGKKSNLRAEIAEGLVEFIEGDLLDQQVVRNVVKDMQTVF